jgi:hypothetical protein
MTTVKEQSRRVQLLFEAFQGRDLLYLHDLPFGVGAGTVSKLVARNVVLLVEVENWPFSKEAALRLLH